VSAAAIDWRRRALDAEQAIREMAYMLQEIDHEPMSPASYVADPAAVEAVRRAMRNQRRRHKPRPSRGGGQ